jgi:hypothetical protein
MTLNLDSPFTNPIAWDTISVMGREWFGKFDIRGAKRAYKWDIRDGMGLEGWLSWYRGWTGPAFTITFYMWADVHFDLWGDFFSPFLYDAHKRPAHTNAAFDDAKKRARDAQDTLNNILATASLSPPKTPAALLAMQQQIQLAREAVVQASGQAAKAAAIGNVPSPGVRALEIIHPQLAMVNIHQVVCEDISPPEKQSDDLMFASVVTLREFRQPPMINATTSPDAAADKPEGGEDDPVIARLQKENGQLRQTAINAGVL